MDLAWLFPLLTALALAVPLGLWLARRRRGPLVELAPPPTPRVIPLVPLPSPEALRALPLPVRACPDCGYLGIRPSEMGDGVFAGGGDLLSAQSCPHCGYSGPPAEFDDAEAYAEYVEGLRRARRG